MKDFLYLDSDYLASFIAQIDNGLVEETREEQSGSEQHEKGKAEISFNPSVKATMGFKKITEIEGELGAGFKSAPSRRTFETSSKSIYIKRRNDEIFNIFEAYFIENGLYRTKGNIAVGSYFRDICSLSFINFTRIESLFGEDLRDTYSHYSKASTFSFEAFELIRKKLNFLKTTIPHDIFLCGENIFIPIKEEFLRGNKEKIGFSFEKSATVVGRVKKLVDSTSKNQASIIRVLDEIQHITFNMLNELGFIALSPSKELYIIYPIAIFF
ncbi:MAG: hypothetical protein LBN05_05110 [Oscillospiraceae bacterium]|nr:hypothetical protein [Oscillospiraceae bacterium]